MLSYGEIRTGFLRHLLSMVIQGVRRVDFVQRIVEPPPPHLHGGEGVGSKRVFINGVVIR
jgi:hypothetical protein